jgi:hypothetical protein
VDISCVEFYPIWTKNVENRGKFLFTWGMRWRSWLRHCPTSRKAADSIPDGVIGTFHLFNPSGRTMSLGSTHPLTEGSKGGRCLGLTTLLPSYADCLEIPGASNSWNPKGLSRPVMGLLYLLFTSVTVGNRLQ